MRMESVICNTGPMIALAGIHQLDLLKELYERVMVPMPVHQEILSGGRYFTGLEDYRRAGWIEISELSTPVDPLLITLLDVGESSVIHGAREFGLTSVLMDERKGRRIARDVYGLRVIGTARVLVDAKQANLIPSVGRALQDNAERRVLDSREDRSGRSAEGWRTIRKDSSRNSVPTQNLFAQNSESAKLSPRTPTPARRASLFQPGASAPGQALASLLLNLNAGERRNGKKEKD